MPTLTWRNKNGDQNTYGISKSITTIGSDPTNDIVLKEYGLAGHCAQIVFDNRDFNVMEVESDGLLQVNGKHKKRTRLAHEDKIQLGEAKLNFSIFSTFMSRSDDQKNRFDLEGLRQLQEFSAKLISHQSLPQILDELMDAVINLTGAAKGFLVLLEDGSPSVKVARNMHRENVSDAVASMSDSIVARVIETKQSLIVSDAMNDTTFGKAESVINLRLNSVMCVPLLEQGRLMGLIYVGNDSIKGLFEARTLELLNIFAAQASILVQNALLLDSLRLQNQSLSEELSQKRFGEIIGSSASMLKVFHKVEKVTSTNVTVMISGETGTGKELIAGEIHRRSSRAGGPFITVNCGAIPENLMESEFFGHVRGAFTGAVTTREGKFQAANKGTIFLDEIGEMSQALQVKLLRVLQEHQVVKVGATKPESLDIRVITATNRDLEAEMKSGRFREDLYYRLNVVSIDLPPLRDREEDIILLARYLLRRYASEYGSRVKGFTPNAIISMRKHSWPGNVRELENRIKKAVILCDGTMVGINDLGLSDDALPEILSLADAKEKFQRDYINQILERNNGNRTKTARDLDVDPRTVFRYLEKE
jgi:transcriptional regulator with GAF, ATPase, and Fis domain